MADVIPYPTVQVTAETDSGELRFAWGEDGTFYGGTPEGVIWLKADDDG